MIGQILRGRYEIIDRLGSGAFGETFRAKDKDYPGEPICVVKRLKLDCAPDILPIVRRLFNQEAEMLSKLGNHSQIPRLLAHFEENKQFYLVQEFIDGEELQKEITGRQLSEQQVIDILQDVLGILDYVHQQQVIHRDLKPLNLIRRRKDNKLVLIDFGAVKEISTVANSTTQTTNATVVIGTPGYMPGEQSIGKPTFNSDIYALGMTGIQALTGVFPRQLKTDPNSHEVCWRNLVKVSFHFADILDKMVRYDFRDRYQSATEVLQALSRFSNPKTAPVTPSPGSKKPLPWKPLAGIGVVAIAAISLTFLKQTPSETLLTYDNPTDGIKIKYPAGWDNSIKAKDPFTGDIAKFVTPKENDLDKYQEDLTISVEDLSNKPATLDEFNKFSITQIQQLNPGANILSQSSISLGTLPAYQVIYRFKDGEFNLQKMQVWTLNNNQAYTITYTAESDKYSKFENSVKSMLNSFEITK
jgi:eukaryotic-like serine/threonine-protein kinase